MAMPTGGEKDTQPPVILSEKTIPRNRSVNFTGNTLLITFDEFVKLNNPKQQVVISPAPQKEPEFLLNGKKLTIRFGEELPPNTTYTIHFGNAISDITENNVAENLQFVFSTGPVLDSLSVKGSVKNASAKIPEKGIWVELYKNENEITSQRPLYLSKTDKSGNFSIDNIAPGEYFIYALKDENNNYQYDRPGEQIAFMNEKIMTGGEIDLPVSLLLFKEDKEKLFIKKTLFEYPDKFTFVFSKPLPFNEPSVKILSTYGIDIEASFTSVSHDSLFLWADWKMENDSVVFMVESKTNNFIDTITVNTADDRTPPEKTFKLKHNITPVFGLYDTIRIWNPNPFDTEFTKGIQLLEDSLPVERKIINGNLPGTEWLIIAHLKERTSYRLLIVPAALEEIFSGAVNDSLDISFTTQKEEYYGNLLLNFSPDVESKFLIQLKNDKGKTIRQQYTSTGTKLNFEKLPPGNYSLSVILDENENGKWDTGQFDKKIQPERIFHYEKPVTIRSNWDVDIDWKLLLL